MTEESLKLVKVKEGMFHTHQATAWFTFPREAPAPATCPTGKWWEYSIHTALSAGSWCRGSVEDGRRKTSARGMLAVPRGVVPGTA